MEKRRRVLTPHQGAKGVIDFLYQSTKSGGCNGVILSLGKAKEVQSRETHEVPIRRKPTANNLFPTGLTCPRSTRGYPSHLQVHQLRNKTRSMDQQRRLSLGIIDDYHVKIVN